MAVREAELLHFNVECQVKITDTHFIALDIVPYQVILHACDTEYVLVTLLCQQLLSCDEMNM